METLGKNMATDNIEALRRAIQDWTASVDYTTVSIKVFHRYSKLVKRTVRHGLRRARRTGRVPAVAMKELRKAKREIMRGLK